jgi:hypothetical protein
MKLVKFEIPTDDRDRNFVLLDPNEVASITGYSFRSLYGGSSPASRITLKNGEVVCVWNDAETVYNRLNEALV